ncbi:MAG: hypothetical protein WAM94_16295, partial [Chromatiaceae bacterium]
MKPPRTVLASGLVLALVLGGPAVGGGDGQQDPTSAPTFSDLDTNIDGHLNKEEASERIGLVEQWDQVDR